MTTGLWNLNDKVTCNGEVGVVVAVDRDVPAGVVGTVTVRLPSGCVTTFNPTTAGEVADTARGNQGWWCPVEMVGGAL